VGVKQPRGYKYIGLVATGVNKTSLADILRKGKPASKSIFSPAPNVNKKATPIYPNVRDNGADILIGCSARQHDGKAYHLAGTSAPNFRAWAFCKIFSDSYYMKAILSGGCGQ
jgi:hypothetical protein